VISPGTGLDCPRHRTRTFTPSCSLASASGGQDHTISPSTLMVLVLHRLRVHRIPASRVVTIAIRPLSSRRDGGTKPQCSEKQKRNIFRGRTGRWNQLGIALRTLVFSRMRFLSPPAADRWANETLCRCIAARRRANQCCKRKTPVAACRRAPPMARLAVDRSCSSRARVRKSPG